jgi:AcrR family transcriptional regulator
MMSHVSERQGVRKARAAETQAALKDAARRLFMERGYLNTKITDITAAAGRATGSFHNHFAGKEELLEALLVDLLAQADDVVLGDLAHDEDFSKISSVRWHGAAYWNFYKAHLPEMIAIKQAAMVDPELGQRLQRIMADDDAHMIQHLSYLPEPQPNPLLQISAMNSLLEGFAYTWLVANPPSGRTITDEEAIDLLTNLLHHGLAGRA